MRCDCRHVGLQKACLGTLQDLAEWVPADDAAFQALSLRVYHGLAPTASLSRTELSFLSTHSETLASATAATLHRHGDPHATPCTHMPAAAAAPQHRSRLWEGRARAGVDQQAGMEAVGSVKSLTAVAVNMLAGATRSTTRSDALAQTPHALQQHAPRPVLHHFLLAHLLHNLTHKFSDLFYLTAPIFRYKRPHQSNNRVFAWRSCKGS